MAKNTPAFQFYPSDFLGGVTLLSDEAVGIYVKLLCTLWIQGNALPGDIDKLARSANTTETAMREFWPELQDKFEIVNGKVTHPRFTKMLEVSAARSENGKKGGRGNKSKPKAKRKQTESKTKANPLKSEERSPKDEDLKSEDWVFPDGWDSPELRQALEGWAEMRKRIRKPINSRVSTSKMFKRFDSPQHLAAAAEECEANEWQGLKPEYGRSPSKAGKSTAGKGSAAYQTTLKVLGAKDDR